MSKTILGTSTSKGFVNDVYSAYAKNADNADKSDVAVVLTPTVENVEEYEVDHVQIFETGVYAVEICSKSATPEQYLTVIIIVSDLTKLCFSSHNHDISDTAANLQVIFNPQGRGEDGTYSGMLTVAHDSSYDWVGTIVNCIQIAKI